MISFITYFTAQRTSLQRLPDVLGKYTGKPLHIAPFIVFSRFSPVSKLMIPWANYPLWQVFNSEFIQFIISNVNLIG